MHPLLIHMIPREAFKNLLPSKSSRMHGMKIRACEILGAVLHETSVACDARAEFAMP